MWYVVGALLFNGSFLYAEDRCATTMSELHEMPRFAQFEKIFSPSGSLAMVNETKGSYFTIDTVTEHFTMTFYTSGLFDLFGVKREGPVKFCDDGKTLRLVGIGRIELLDLSGEVLTVGDGGPRMRFRIGGMPEKLGDLHGIVQRGIAGGR